MKPTVEVQGKTFEAFLSGEEIREKVKELAEHITQDLEHRDPLFICVLNGALYFASDLTRMFPFQCEISCIKVASYSGMSSGKLQEIAGLNDNLHNRDVVILEDIIDTGNTAAYLKKHLREKGAGNIYLTALFYKPSALKTDIKPDYTGFEVPDKFLVGYGLDYNKRGRNLEGVYQLKN